MAMSVLGECCPEIKENIQIEGYVQPKYVRKFLLDFWDAIFNKLEKIEMKWKKIR